MIACVFSSITFVFVSAICMCVLCWLAVIDCVCACVSVVHTCVFNLQAFSVSRIYGAFCDAGQNYKNLVGFVKGLGNHLHSNLFYCSTIILCV